MRFNYFVSKQHPQFIQNCQRYFEIGETGIYLFLPMSDLDLRVEQIIQDYQTSIRFSALYLNTLMVHKIGKIDEFIEQQFPKKQNEIMGIFVIRSEMAVAEKNTVFFEKLLDFSSKDNTYRFLFMTEMDFTHPEIARQFVSRTRLFNSINYYPLYSEEDSISFLIHLSNEWHFKMNKKDVNKIWECCGGHFGLLKEATRRFMIEPDKKIEDICNSETMKFRAEQIYYSMLPSERVILKKIITNSPIDHDSLSEMHSLNYLKRMGLVHKDSITLPLLTDFIKSSVPKPNITLSKNHIVVNNIIIDSSFSRKELKAFRLLLARLNQIVPREDIAKAIWPIDTESKYSEWAIDRIMARLRDKIEQLGLDGNLIKTIRGKGYIVSGL